MLREGELMTAFEPGSHEAGQALEAVREAAWETMRPCVVFGAQLVGYAVGTQPEAWGAMLGDLVVRGDSPADAMRSFDQAWRGLPCEKMIRLPDEARSEETGRECWRHEKCVLRPGHEGDCAPEAS
jgi:hypothetical protein